MFTDWGLGQWLLSTLGAAVVLFLLSGIRFIPNNRIGIVEKRMSGKGSLTSGIIALGGEAGFQPHVLRGGLHYLLPIQYAVHVHSLVTIPQGRIGYVFARTASRCRLRRRWRRTRPRPFQTPRNSCGRAGSAVRSARSFVRAPTRSISPSSS